MHNTKALHTSRVLAKFPAIVAKLAGMFDRFTTMLGCVDVAFLPDGILDQLPAGRQLGATRVGGIDLNRERMRNTLSAVLALAVAPDGFTVADLAAKVHTLTGQNEQDYTVRQAAYDLHANCAANNSSSSPTGPAATTSPGQAARTIAALLALREHVIAPIIAGIQPPRARPPTEHARPRRPRLRTTPRRHANPLHRPSNRRRRVTTNCGSCFASA